MKFHFKLSLIILSLVFGLNENSTAQHLSLFDIDSDKYPTVEAGFYAFDEQLNQIITLKKEDVAILENEGSQIIIDVINPKPKAPVPVSVVLAVDISGSMNGDGIEKAKNATSVFVNKLPLDISECAITSFDGYSYVNADFSQNKALLLKQINTLTPDGGTDYNAAFSTPRSGALDIVSKGKNKKVIIFLTDGLAEANKQEIIAKATSEGIQVYCITLGMNMPDQLKSISSQTHGRFYENVNTKEEMKKVYEEIFFHVQEYEPSRVIWESKRTCQNTKLTVFSIPKKNLAANRLTYILSKENGIALLPDKQKIQFEFEELIKPIESSLTLSAINADFAISSFSTTLSGLSIPESVFPMTIKKGEKTTFKLQFKPLTPFYKTATVTFNNNRCKPIQVYVSSLPIGDKIKNPVNIQSPNGGETFTVGVDTLITWTGINGKAKLSYSLDNGKTWKLISNDAKNNSHPWTVPEQVSSTAKVKVEANEEFDDPVLKTLKKLYTIPHGNVRAGGLYPDLKCTKYILYTSDDQIIVKDLNTGNTLSTFPKKNRKVFFNEEGNKIIFVKDGEKGIVYDATTGYELETLPILKKIKEISINGNEYLHKPESGPMEIINIQTGKTVGFMKYDHVGFIPYFDDNYISNSPNYGKSDYECYVWNRKTEEYEIFKTPEKNVQRGLLSKDNKYLVIWSWNSNGSNTYFTVYDLKSKEEIYSKRHGKMNYGILLKVGTKLMMCPINGKMGLVEISSGKVLHTFSVTTDDFYFLSSNDEFVFHNNKATQTTTAYRTGYGKTLEISNDSDESDQVFSIVDVKLDVKDVTFKNITVNEKEDQVVNSFIKNTNPFPIEITSIKMPQANKSLSIVSGADTPFTLKPNESKAIEFSFRPTSILDNKETILTVTNRGTFQSSVNLNSINPTFSIPEKTIYLGKFNVGTKHDTSLTNLLKNTGNLNQEITSVEVLGPGSDEYKITSFTKKTLQPSEALSLNLEYKAKKRGMSSCKLLIKTSAPSQSAVIHVIAEGVSPTVYKIKATSFDKRTNQKLVSQITCHDLETKHIISSTSVNTRGEHYYSLNPDRKYLVRSKKEGYLPDSTEIDLTTFSLIGNRDVKLFLESSNENNANSFLLYGAIIDDSSQVHINGHLSIVSKNNGDTLWGNTPSSPTEGYRVYLPFDQEYEVIAESEDFFPRKTSLVVNQEGEKDSLINFHLTRITLGKSVNLKNVLFVQSRADLLSSSYDELNMLLKYLADKPDLHIELSGHTDNQGNARLNIKLSNDRVLAIKKYLTENGIDEKRISGKGYGDKYPIASNSTEATRKLNRRVEFVLKN